MNKGNISGVAIHCLSLDCAERKSICCGASSEASSADEGTSFFICSKCKHEFISPPCENVKPKFTDKEALKIAKAYIKKFPNQFK